LLFRLPCRFADRDADTICRQPAHRYEVATMKRTIFRAAVLLFATASGGLAQETTASAVDCSAFRKEDYGYLVTKTTRIATPPLDVTVPKGMPIRRGEKAAAVQGKDLAEVIDQNCAG
jgi:hypothetical protein